MDRSRFHSSTTTNGGTLAGLRTSASAFSEGLSWEAAEGAGNLDVLDVSMVVAQWSLGVRSLLHPKLAKQSEQMTSSSVGL